MHTIYSVMDQNSTFTDDEGNIMMECFFHSKEEAIAYMSEHNIASEIEETECITSDEYWAERRKTSED